MKSEFKVKFKNFILDGKFVEAEKIMEKISVRELDEILFVIAYDYQTINPYGFIWHILKKKEKAVYHVIASVILSDAINYIPYAYNLSLFHVKRAIELDPKNLDYIESLLIFYQIPEKLISDGEALKIATNVLKKDPKRKLAKRVLEELTKKRNRKSKMSMAGDNV